MGKQVLTHTINIEEDLKQYLKHQRNPKVFSEIVEETRDVWDWDDIYDREERIKTYGF